MAEPDERMEADAGVTVVELRDARDDDRGAAAGQQGPAVGAERVAVNEVHADGGDAKSIARPAIDSGPESDAAADVAGLEEHPPEDLLGIHGDAAVESDGRLGRRW